MYKLYCRAYQLVFRCATPFLPWRRPELLKDFMSVARLLQAKAIQSALVVTDAGLVTLGLHARLLTALDSAGVRCALYDKTAQNPTIENIEEALALYKREGCTAIIALGGGSPMDCAKGVGARAARPRKTITQMRGLLKVLKKIPLLIAIPTTAGTGSETTVAAIITDSATHEKYAVNDPVLIPHYALLEPSLTVGLPPHITAWTGMDALCHAVEAYINRSNMRQTRLDALKATELIFQNLSLAFSNGQDLSARKNMQTAAFLAGAAFTRAYVGNIHAVAHTLGGQYGTQHGLANSVIMPYVLEMYGQEIDKPLSELAAAAGIAQPSASSQENAAKFIAAIRAMNAGMGIPDKLADLREKDIPKLAARALREANPLYPVPVIFGKTEMEKVYYSLLRG
ncbi:MAG: iron-containing alcohol dehydrogenase [Desulfobulbaceae bacterium]|jgi:alcohol dehydrogenase class IV|nr:iron-containing alcohol dehydrogenase [Desulfobulbaceae bacterium]